jgi:hypothetical protein
MQINIQTTTGRITDIKEDLFIGYSPGIL